MQVRSAKGIHLPDLDLWLDAHQARATVVVSHAHADHVANHQAVISTVATAALMRQRGATRPIYKTLAYREPMDWGSARVTLYPAGHILGSAQVLVESRGVRMLYSGDFKLRAGLTTERAEVPEADILVMETTFGRPRYRFPQLDALTAQLVSFVTGAIGVGKTPVLLCYSLGKGQEVLAALSGLDFPVYLEEGHWQMSELYRSLGRPLPPYVRFQPGQRLDGPLLCAAGCRRRAWFHRLGPTSTAYVSGWAMDGGAARRFGVDCAIPLSDHADYEELLEYVARCGAGTVYTVHGFSEEFAADLRGRGIQAECLERVSRAAQPRLPIPP